MKSFVVLFTVLIDLLLLQMPGLSVNAALQDDNSRHLTAGDVIEVIVENAPELSGKYLVCTSGRLFMPYLNYIEVAGKTSEELRTFIDARLRGRYLKDPKVTISVKEGTDSEATVKENTESFVVGGEVQKPGSFSIGKNISLRQLKSGHIYSASGIEV